MKKEKKARPELGDTVFVRRYHHKPGEPLEAYEVMISVSGYEHKLRNDSTVKYFAWAHELVLGYLPQELTPEIREKEQSRIYQERKRRRQI